MELYLGEQKQYNNQMVEQPRKRSKRGVAVRRKVPLKLDRI